ncbi:hypothetical protein BH11PSE9_BH11PSE9_09160 [soil metagenome]
MKRWIKRTFIGLIGATVVLGSLGACSTHRFGGGHEMSAEDSAKMRERMLERAGKELNLDDAQKQRLAVLADKLRDSRTAVMGATDPRTEAQALVAGTTFDLQRAQALVDGKLGAVRGKSPEVIAAAADFYDSLRPEQQQQVRDFMAKRRGWGHRG